MISLKRYDRTKKCKTKLDLKTKFVIKSRFLKRSLFCFGSQNEQNFHLQVSLLECSGILRRFFLRFKERCKLFRAAGCFENANLGHHPSRPMKANLQPNFTQKFHKFLHRLNKKTFLWLARIRKISSFLFKICDRPHIIHYFYVLLNLFISCNRFSHLWRETALNVTSNMLCTTSGNPNQIIGTCHGDDGSPLVREVINPKTTFYQISIHTRLGCNTIVAKN